MRDHLVPEFTVEDCYRRLHVSGAGYHRSCGHPIGKREARRKQLTGKVHLLDEAARRIYHKTQRTNAALPVPAVLTSFLRWSRERVDPLSVLATRPRHWLGSRRPAIRQ